MRVIVNTLCVESEKIFSGVEMPAVADLTFDEALVMDRPWNGERLREVREMASLSQAQLGELLGLWQGAIGNWEHGTRKPNVDDLYLLCDALGCSCIDFYKELGTNVRFRHKPRKPKRPPKSDDE